MWNYSFCQLSIVHIFEPLRLWFRLREREVYKPSRKTIGFDGGLGRSPAAPMTMKVCPAFGAIFFHGVSS
jgi:hypothetical protein